MIETVLVGLLSIHIAAGVVALASGTVAVVTRKGGQRHRNAGRIYVMTMAVVVVTAMPIALADSNLFLFTIAIFSGYLVFTGDRVLSRKRPEPGVANMVDWIGHTTMLVAGIGMIALGTRNILTDVALGPVLVVFGLIGSILAVRELYEIFRPPADQMAWFYRHLGFMGGGFIATVTASATVNLSMLPPLARWLGPTAVGVPLIIYATWTYQQQFSRPNESSAAE